MMSRPRADVDDDVRWLGTGYVSPLPTRSYKRKNPIGFIWPQTKKKTKPAPKKKPAKKK
jgi:hypothetical protein